MDKQKRKYTYPPLQTTQCAECPPSLRHTDFHHDVETAIAPGELSQLLLGVAHFTPDYIVTHVLQEAVQRGERTRGCVEHSSG